MPRVKNKTGCEWRKQARCKVYRSRAQENSPNQHKGTLFFPWRLCRYREVLIVQIADFDLWLLARDVWLFLPAHIQCQIDSGALVEFPNQSLMKSWEIQQPWGACVGASVTSMSLKNRRAAKHYRSSRAVLTISQFHSNKEEGDRTILQCCHTLLNFTRQDIGYLIT